MKNKHGGKRPGAGAKLKYNESTAIVSARCPKSQVNKLKQLIKTFLDDKRTITN